MLNQEVIAWTKRWRARRGKPFQGSEVSEENGIFNRATATLTYSYEAPAVRCAGDSVALSNVKIATPEQRNHYLKTVAALNAVREQLRAAQRDIAANGLPMTWEWILQHGKPREDGKVPVPYHSKKALVTLRKGSKVVITTQSSEYHRIAGRVGKIVKKKSKFVQVDFGRLGIYKIPYSDLKPAAQVSKKQRKEAKEGSEISAEVVRSFNKVFGENQK